MKIELLIEIAHSALNDELCDGCEKYGSPYSYYSCGNDGGCEKCRSMAMKEIKLILEKQKNN